MTNEIAIFAVVIVAAVLLGPSLIELAEFARWQREQKRRAAKQQFQSNNEYVSSIQHKSCTGASKV